MKRIRIFGVLALTVVCLMVMSGCGRRGGNTETDGSEMQSGSDQSGSDQAGDNTAATDGTDESRDHGHNNTQNGTDDENGTGGLLDDIGDGITGAMDDLGDAAGDIVDDIGGGGTTGDDADRSSAGNSENRMR